VVQPRQTTIAGIKKIQKVNEMVKLDRNVRKCLRYFIGLTNRMA